MIIFILAIFKNSLKLAAKPNERSKIDLNLFIPIILTLFIEIWPFKATGRFFTNWNAAFFWINIALLASFVQKRKGWVN